MIDKRKHNKNYQPQQKTINCGSKPTKIMSLELKELSKVVGGFEVGCPDCEEAN